jgi:hypothetical protein
MMQHLILATGQIETSELAGISQETCSLHTIAPGETLPLNLFSLLLSEVKLFDETMGDERTAVTAIVRPQDGHTALVFDDEPTMVQAKLLVHGMDDTQWSANANLSHAVRFSANFTEKQLNEVALLGAQLCRLMAVEPAYRRAAEALTDPEHCDAATRRRIITDSQASLDEVMATRAETTRRLIEIQGEFGICPCRG